MHGVSYQSFYRLVFKVCEAVTKEFPIFHPYFDDDSMKEVAQEFGSEAGGIIHGCVGALDGIAMKVNRPEKRYAKNAKAYWNRKSFYAINMQAIADKKRRLSCYNNHIVAVKHNKALFVQLICNACIVYCRFLWASMSHPGSVHDSRAWKSSKLYRQIEARGGLPFGYWIAGDEAYGNCNWLLTPYSASGKGTYLYRLYKDSFNFYQSSTRITVECAFGMLVGRWGIFHRALDIKLPNVRKVVSASMSLHNDIECLHRSRGE